METKKDIGRLFKETLEEGKKAPSNLLWTQLETQLKKDKKRRAVWLWSRLAFVLLLIIGSSVIWHYSTLVETTDLPENLNETNRDKINVSTILEADTLNSVNNNYLKSNEYVDTLPNIDKINADKATPENEETKNTQKIKVTSNQVSTSQTLNHPTITKSTSTNKTTLPKYSKTASKNNIDTVAFNEIKVNSSLKKSIKTKETVLQNSGSKTKEKSSDTSKNKNLSALNALNNKNTSNELVSDSLKKDSLDLKKKALLAEIEKEKSKDSLITEGSKKKRLAFSIHGATIYYNFFKQGSILDGTLSENETEGTWNMGYGFFFYYKASERLQLRFGANKLRLGYLTKNIPEFDNNNNATDLLSYQIEAPRLVSKTQLSQLFNDTGLVNLKHELSYIEVPLEVNYLFKTGKLEFAGVAGFSTWLLDRNEVFATSPSGSVFIGNATEVSDISFSLNAGTGIYYNFANNWLFTVEPVFKYQLKPFKDNPNNINVYTFGIYGGLKLKF
ncbi:hypothetical protein [Ascidiimonas sp. W6]|uniref:hypothetical protein n=1 Tax=Ascidiimonas meishanensis TaxID=3128903 RepID=UPI0030EF0BF8